MEGESLSAHITFSFEPGKLCDEVEDRYFFWDLPLTVGWFKKRGYTLYERLEGGKSKPALPFEPSKDAKYPFAYHESVEYSHIKSTPLLATDNTGKIVFAQDSLNRHVAIKLVRADTDEYRVLRFLSEQSMDTLQENCVIPVLELLPTEGFWFAVMPRWGPEIDYPDFSLLIEPVDIVYSMLTALAFLHSNNIAHGDLEVRNVLVNHFCDPETVRYSSNRCYYRRARLLSYALFDFDHSTMLPPTADKTEFRLPYQKSWGSFNHNGDTDAGEYDFDPFAFDVGNLGDLLFRTYGYLIPSFPGLVPLFDMMTTWDIPRRLTAAQSLEFFESRLCELPEDQFQISVEEVVDSDPPSDPWGTLPPDLAETWRVYRTLPEPWSRRVLCWINRQRRMPHYIIPWTRWLCFQMFSAVPRQIYHALVKPSSMLKIFHKCPLCCYLLCWL